MDEVVRITVSSFLATNASSWIMAGMVQFPELGVTVVAMVMTTFLPVISGYGTYASEDEIVDVDAEVDEKELDPEDASSPSTPYTRRTRSFASGIASP